MTNSEELNRRKARLSEARRALLLKRLQGEKSGESADSSIAKQPQIGLMPLSYTQQRVWFLQQLYPDNRAYNMNEAWRVRGTLNVSALQQALQKVVARHSSLRTCFMARDNEPMQKVLDDIPLPLNLNDISHLPTLEREQALQEMVLAEGNYDFDLSRAPLIRVSLIRLDSKDHVLQLVLHHIITDEWSNDIIWRELADYYTRALESDTGDLSEVAIQYTDYARWQREQVASRAFDRQMRYWGDQLSGDLPLLQLPTDRPRPAEQSLRGGIVRRFLPAELLQKVQMLSQQAGATLYATLLAAFQALLYRYSSQGDILVGTPIANRQRVQTDNVIGMFINTTVMRANVSAEMPFRQLLAQVKQTAMDALANQDLPFDLLVQTMHPDRDLSYNPMFQTMFVFRSDGVERTLTGLEFEALRIDRGVAKFDLTIFAGEEDGRLLSALEYSTDLFDEATVKRMLDHWQALLEAIAADPSAPVGSLPLLSEAERKLLLATWNDTAVHLSETRCLHELISAQAARVPQATAVASSNGDLSYGELESRANQLAHYLVRHGIAPGTPVGLFTERSAEMVIGILGILKAGGAYVPLAPEYPTERIAFALQDTGTPLVITQSHLADRLPQTSADIVVVNGQQLAAEFEWPAAPPETAVSLDHLAYIIYTSGSTGEPKGVMVTHRNLLASTLAREAYYKEPVERFLLLSSFAFDSSVAGIFWTLSSGGALFLPPPDGEKDVHMLAQIITREQITHTLALPTLYRLLLAYAPKHSLESLKVVIVAGEACPTDLGDLHYRVLPRSTLFNEYGPTEATVWCSVYELPRSSDGTAVPIGRPIANCKLFILDQMRQPVPIGVSGELYVAGASVTPGYWNKPELTAQFFSPLVLDGHEVSGSAYRTGDLARWRADGQIEFLGRVDNQVKVRGYRIELGEIESRLMQHPTVQEAVVTVWEQPERGAGPDKTLAVYVIGETVGSVEESYSRELQSYLASSMPDYMMPNQIVVLAQFPRTPSGKVDRRRLPLPAPTADRKQGIVPPRTEAEKILARIWSDVLKISEVGVEDKFFELGGDSIMSIQVIARAREEGLALTPRQLFKEQTIGRLADVAVPSDDGHAVDQSQAGGPVPLTPIQHWFFTQKLRDRAYWNQAAWFETAADLDLGALQQALNALVTHHPMLRARFHLGDAGWQQEVVAEAPVIELERIALSGLEPAEQDEALLTSANILHAGLNLSRGPLLRAAWFDLGNDRRPRLFITVHHLVIDAVSWNILVPNLLTSYRQIAAGEPPSLPAVRMSYARWSEKQARLAQSPRMRHESTYWRQMSRQAAPLPRDGTGDKDNTEGEADLVTVVLDGAHTEQLLREAHNAYHTRIDDLLLAAMAHAVCSWNGERSLLLNLERHGREEIDPQFDMSQTVGWFTSLFPVTLALPEKSDAGDTIRTVKEQLRAIPQNGIGYGILRYLGDEDIRQELATKLQPEILFNYLGVAADNKENAGPIRRMAASTGQAYGPQNKRAHLIDVNAQIVDGRLRARWQYAPAYFQKTTIEKVALAFINELGRIIDHCLEVEQGQYTPSDFPLADLQQNDLDSLSDLLAEVE